MPAEALADEDLPVRQLLPGPEPLASFICNRRELQVGRVAGQQRPLLVDETTVARRLARLETALGTRLLGRTPDGIALTLAGESVHAFPRTPPELMEIWLVAHADVHRTGRVRAVLKTISDACKRSAALLEG